MAWQRFLCASLFCSATLLAAEPTLPTFRAVEIDSRVGIGYGVCVADVDGDHKPDILLADKNQIAWYRNPTWEKFVIAENLTKLDNVCIAAADIDENGKAEIAIGAGWNPADTVNSGAAFTWFHQRIGRQNGKPSNCHTSRPCTVCAGSKMRAASTNSWSCHCMGEGTRARPGQAFES